MFSSLKIIASISFVAVMATANAARGSEQRSSVEKLDTWNFTAQDYEILHSSGKSIRFESDSAWLPSSLKNNLMTVLDYVLGDPKGRKSTDGVNIRDFYHGHLLCKRPSQLANPPESLLAKKFASIENSEFAKNRIASFAQLTPDNIDRFVLSITSAESRTSKLLSKLLGSEDCKDAAVVYHTFEWSGPNMSPGDPRRNLMVPLGSTETVHYAPPDPSNASSVEEEFDMVFQFAFLIDQNGVVHATIGSFHELSRVIGKSTTVQCSIDPTPPCDI